MATLKDVAQYAGVSVSAVSRILNNDSHLSVPDETRNKVKEAAKELGYIPLAKRSSKHREQFHVMIIQGFSLEQEVTDTYYISIIYGIEKYLKEHDIIVKRYRSDASDLYDALRQVDGVLCVGKFQKEMILQFKDLCKNIVLLDMDLSPIVDCCVTLDFDDAMYQVVTYLHNLHHRHVGFIGRKEYQENKMVHTRMDCFLKYCQMYDMQVTTYELSDELTSHAGYEAIYDIEDLSHLPSAIFAVNDLIAMGAMLALQERGLQVPRDVSVMGFDDLEASNFTSPALTTMYAPSSEMGKIGSMVLKSMLEGENVYPARIQLPCTLLERKSVESYKE